MVVRLNRHGAHNMEDWFILILIETFPGLYFIGTCTFYNMGGNWVCLYYTPENITIETMRINRNDSMKAKP